MIGVLELVLGVDPAFDPDVPWDAGRGDRDRVCDRDPRRRGEPASHPVARAEGAQEENPGEHRDRARGEEEDGDHGGHHSPHSSAAWPSNE